MISLKNHNLGKSRNFRSLKSKVMECWGGKLPTLFDFWKFITVLN